MHYFIKIQPNMSEQEKKQQRIYDLLTPKPSQRIFFQKKSFLRKRGVQDWTKNEKFFLKLLPKAIQKDPSTSLRKHANELKVHEKTVRTAIKQDLSLGLYHLSGAIKKTKQMQLPIQILVRLRLLLRKNGIKCLKNLI